MATGPEHYRYAEQHLAAAYVASINDGTAAYHHARAQVHATLAQAAAAATMAWTEEPTVGDYGYALPSSDVPDVDQER